MTNEININALGYKVNQIKSEQGGANTTTVNAKQPEKQLEAATLSAKQQLNTSIVQANIEVSVNAGNEPLALLYKAAIEGINQELEGEFGTNAIQNAYDSGLDVSPEATADRIVSMSTAFFSQYKNQNPDMSDEEAVVAFTDIIRGGIDTGFSEARKVLSGLEVLEGDIATNIDSTYQLVQQGLQSFIDSYTTSSSEKIPE